MMSEDLVSVPVQRPAVTPPPRWQKALKLIDRDKIEFLLGNVNSALANASVQRGVCHIEPGGHTDSVTGTQCR